MGASHVRGFVAEGANVVIADVLEQEGWTLGDHANHRRCRRARTWSGVCQLSCFRVG